MTRLDLHTSEILHNIAHFGSQGEPTSTMLTSISPQPSSSYSSPLSSLSGSTRQPTGVWSMILSHTHGMIKALTVDLHDIVHVCKAVSQGDLTKRVTVEVRSLNSCFPLMILFLQSISLCIYRSILSFRRSKRQSIPWWIRYCLCLNILFFTIHAHHTVDSSLNLPLKSHR